MTKAKKFITCDGNQAAAHIAYMFSEVAAIYPITPSSTMAEYVDEWAAQGRKNLFGETVMVQEMQSEGGAVGALHGSLQAGALTNTFTASQGLLLMIPNMYKIAGEKLPSVFHVSARSLAGNSLSIFGDHMDVMACRQTGFAMLCEGSVQEVMDLAPVAHLATLKSRIPFLNFFDGFRTSHEIQKIELLEQEDIAPLVDWNCIQEFRDRALSPTHPVVRGTAENPETFFTHKESENPFYNAVPDIVAEYMDKISAITGRKYAPFTYYGAEDADRVIVVMGSATEAIKEAIDYMMARGEKVGLVSVHLYRPFSVKYLAAVMPKTVKRIAVLDRTKEPGSNGEPLYLDVVEAFSSTPELRELNPTIVGGRFALASNDTTPAVIMGVYENLALPEPKNHFTIGIVDDVTFLSLPKKEEIAVVDGMFEAKFYGLGADGTVGANKNSVKIIGENTQKYCQAYFSYDSKKSGGFTCSHLRFGDKPIRSTYLVNTPNFVACHVQAYLKMYDVTRGLQNGGTFLLNTVWEGEELAKHLPNKVKRCFAEKNINVYYINATKIAQEIGLGNRTNTILQSAFFRITGVIPVELAVEQMKKFIVKSYGKKGQDIVDKNNAAVDRGGEFQKLVVDPAWANLPNEVEEKRDEPEFITKIVRTINAQEGDKLPVSAFKGLEDGTWPVGTSAYEKRGVSAFVPKWDATKCIQCNRCAFVCPHAAIRPIVMDEQEAAGLNAVTSVKIPNGVMIVDNSSFYGCTSLTSITIPDSVTSIGSSAFYGCTSLTSITIPDSITSIGEGAFYNCDSLTSITIPDSVTSIGSSAFSGCRSLTSITIGGSVTSIGGYAFSDCTSLTSITIPDSVTGIGYWAFECCTSLTSITIGDSVTSIGRDAFYYCTSLTSITIGGSVTSIGEAAFSGCTSLKSVYINSLDTWFNIYFYDSHSNPLIGGADLYVNGEKLVDLVIPHYVSYIKSYVFNGCLSLESVTIHNGVYAIREYAFNNCDNIMQINYYGTQDEWNAITKGVYNYPLYLATLNLIECENHVYDGISDKVCNVCAKERTYVPGDLAGNYEGGDGEINNKDLGVLMQYLNGWNYTNIVLEAADVNGDGAVNNRDYGILMRYINGWDIELK